MGWDVPSQLSSGCSFPEWEEALQQGWGSLFQTPFREEPTPCCADGKAGTQEILCWAQIPGLHPACRDKLLDSSKARG